MPRNLDSTETILFWQHRLARTVGLGLLMLLVVFISARFASNSKDGAWVRATANEVTATEPRSVLPHGWRRTIHGWERVSDWGMYPAGESLSLGQWIVHQRSEEPRWVQTFFGQIASIPPLLFASGQLFAVLLVSRIGRDQRCHSARE